MECDSCGAEILDDDFARCPECGDEILAVTNTKKGFLTRIAERKEEIEKIQLTTAPTLENFKVIETIEIVTSECAYGINMFSDFFSGLSDFFGGRSSSVQNVLRDARRTCLYELKREAFQVGANAVIAVNLDYSEFSGKGKSMLFLVASGTAVTVEKNQFKDLIVEAGSGAGQDNYLK